ncbi:MAG TPA: 3'(2'),5'-bisphosphate nucleotidase CysQ [Polyangiaceae bacterium]
MRYEAEVALRAARAASELILHVYAEEFAVEYKAKDDPVTRADREANALIVQHLARAFPGVPVVAEESPSDAYAGFAREDSCWFVDPLDGTREFVAKNGEFAVMIGLAEKGRPTVGVIVAPAWGRVFVGVVGEGAWEAAADGSLRPISVSPCADVTKARFVVSRSRAPERVAGFVEGLGAAPARPHGSSGLKGVLVATGEADVYLQPGRAGMRWDACATDALVRAAGGELTDAHGDPIDYKSEDIENSRGMVGTNGKLHRAIVEALEQRRAR